MSKQSICSVEDCSNKRRKLQYCDIHYSRVYRTGQLGKVERRNQEKHGKTNSREYRIWAGMISRCYNKKSTGFANYGGKGISVCDSWRDSFANFHADMGNSEGLSIDRIDGKKGYSPENCRWADRTQQSTNQGLRIDNSTGYKGVMFNKKLHKYQAYIQTEGKRTHLGVYESLNDAAKARKAAEQSTVEAV